MGSDSANNSIEKVFIGSKGTFTVSRTLGEGGNGIVYCVSFDEKGIQNLNMSEGALKEFNAINSRKNRLIRFEKEIEVMNKLGKILDGIIPILDHSVNSSVITCCYPWYLIPIAKAYSSAYSRSSMYARSAGRSFLESPKGD